MLEVLVRSKSEWQSTQPMDCTVVDVDVVPVLMIPLMLPVPGEEELVNDPETEGSMLPKIWPPVTAVESRALHAALVVPFVLVVKPLFQLHWLGAPFKRM